MEGFKKGLKFYETKYQTKSQIAVKWVLQLRIFSERSNKIKNIWDKGVWEAER